MQETRFLNENGEEQRLVELFSVPAGEDAKEKLFRKMNDRLFQLEQQGHSLVQQKEITLSEKLASERSKKAKKKLARMKRASA